MSEIVMMQLAEQDVTPSGVVLLCPILNIDLFLETLESQDTFTTLMQKAQLALVRNTVVVPKQNWIAWLPV